jgi:hypothetical protein
MKTNKFLRMAAILLVAAFLTTGPSVATYSTRVQGGTVYARVAAFKVLVAGVDIARANEGDVLAFNLYDTLYELSSACDEGVPLNETDCTYVCDEQGACEVECVYVCREYRETHIRWPLNPGYAPTTPGGPPGRDVQIIGPGSGGEFTILVENLSEVPISYSFSLTHVGMSNFLDGGEHEPTGAAETPMIPIQFRQWDDQEDDWSNDWFEWERLGDLLSSGDLTVQGGGVLPAMSSTAGSVQKLIQWRWVFQKTVDEPVPCDPECSSTCHLGWCMDNHTDNVPQDTCDTQLGIYARDEVVRLGVPLVVRAEQLDRPHQLTP